MPWKDRDRSHHKPLAQAGCGAFVQGNDSASGDHPPNLRGVVGHVIQAPTTKRSQGIRVVAHARHTPLDRPLDPGSDVPAPQVGALGDRRAGARHTHWRCGRPLSSPRSDGRRPSERTGAAVRRRARHRRSGTAADACSDVDARRGCSGSSGGPWPGDALTHPQCAVPIPVIGRSVHVVEERALWSNSPPQRRDGRGLCAPGRDVRDDDARLRRGHAALHAASSRCAGAERYGSTTCPPGRISPVSSKAMTPLQRTAHPGSRRPR